MQLISYLKNHTKGTLLIVLSLIVSLILLIPIFNSCTTGATDGPGEKGGEHKDIHEMSFMTTVCLVPLDNVSEKQMVDLKEKLKTNFADSVWMPYEFVIFEGMASPESCKNDLKTRLSAKKMISFLENHYGKAAEKKAKTHKVDAPAYYIIGVTNKDIATNVHGKADYGILGLSYLGGHRASIISTYRLKNSKDLWKLALHEFGHGYFGAPHCPNDDPHCILQDAKGGNPHFERKNSLCRSCWLTYDICF